MNYKQYSKRIFFIVLCLLICSSSIYPQDTVSIQTLKFSDINNRRYIWKFPDESENFRKILMYVTLKCDRQTAHDIFDCGEWDYLAHLMVHKHTGVMDSSLYKVPKYNWGSGFPDTLKYITTPTKNTYSKVSTKKIIDNVLSESAHELLDGTEEIIFENKPTKIQILFSKDYLKDKNLLSKTFKRLKIIVNTTGVTLKNFTLKYKFSGKKTLSEFEIGTFTSLYDGDISFVQAGDNFINFSDDFKIGTLQGFVLQISYDSIENGESISLAAGNYSDIVISDTKDSFLEFDGRHDHVNCGIIDKLKGAKKYTVEMWLKLDSWRNHGFFFKIDDALQFKTAEEYQQPQRYYWYSGDSSGYGIMVAGNVDYSGAWKHFAFVYDATKEQYDGRIKFYINGSEVQGNIRGRFPDAFPDADKFLKLVSESSTMDCDIDEFRIWTDALDRNTIFDWMNKTIDESHPNYNSIAAYYTMDKVENNILKDESGNGYDGTMIGAPIQRTFPIADFNKNQTNLSKSPQLFLVDGQYEYSITDDTLQYEIENSPMSIVTYELDNKKAVISNMQYVWEPGTFYTYDVAGNKIDSVIYTATDTLIQDTISYYGNPYEKTEPYEIGRYITPYGKGLDLGQDGFTWIYDVTDYRPLLTGDVDFEAGNQQELIDVRFDFIKGTPPRDVLKINRIWGPMGSFSYKNLDSDISFPAKSIQLSPEAKQFKVRARLTGHGHNSNDGEYPHCCEWKDNAHYLFVNSEQIAEWKIWRYTQCGLNAIYPQGGTWPGQREGWCPGDMVYDYDYEITDYVSVNSVTIDYDITDVPANNQGMGNGNYIANMELFEYSDFNHDVDAEVYRVMSPSNEPYYSRFITTCYPPSIIIRNNGKNPLTSLTLNYSVSGGVAQNYNWAGNIQPNTFDTLMIPVENNAYLIGDDMHEFTVSVSEPNGTADKYTVNDSYTTQFDMPDMYKEMVIWYRTNNEPQYYEYNIRDVQGNVVFNRAGLNSNTLYKDEIILPSACYMLEFLSMRNTGLSYWAYAGQGQGYIRIYDKNEQLLKSFNSDFGYGIYYSFDLGGILYVQEPGYENLMTIYPNPAEDFVNISLDYYSGDAVMELYNYKGELLQKEHVTVDEKFSKRINVAGYASGTYFIRIYNDKFDVTNKFVKKGK
ncbi:MAG: LamG-like jellyroll fold domain-containing protein [bacterium]